MNENDKKLAWELYVELSHRITKVPFTEYCFVDEALSSLYKIMGFIREQMKQTEPLSDYYNILVGILEFNLRDFVTNWHYRCRSLEYNTENINKQEARHLVERCHTEFKIAIEKLQENMEMTVLPGLNEFLNNKKNEG